MKRKGKWIAGAVLLLAMAAVVLLYQRDRSARYPLDFTRDELASATVGANYTETLTLTEPEELDALYEALERMRVVGEAERDEGALMGAQAYILKIELKDGGGRTFSYEQRDAGGSGVLSRGGHPDCQVRRLDMRGLWQSITGEYPGHA
nr:hypothetical protein [uncultured Dysosmobacter sp.]